MAAPASAIQPLTDEQLKTLIGTATQEDIDLLSDEEAARLDAMVSEPPKTAESPAEKIPGIPPVREFGATDLGDPLSGKPTLAEFERGKVLADTPRMGLPTGRTQRPPMPQEGPTDLKSFLQSIGSAIQGGADRPPSVDTPVEAPMAADAQLSDPARVEAQVRQQQDQLIRGGQPMNLMGGNAPNTDHSAAVLGNMAQGMIRETVASMSEFVANPMRQLATRPIEFGANVLQGAMWLKGAKAAVGALRAAPEAIDDAAAIIRNAHPDDIIGAQAELETRLDQVSAMQDMNRQMGGDPEFADRLRKLSTDLEDAQQTIAKVKGPLPEPEPFKIMEQTSLVESPPPSGTVTEATATAQATVYLTDVLSTAPAGALLLKGIAEDDKADPTPKQGSPLAWKNALWAIPGGLFAFGAVRFLVSPEVRTALAQFTRLDKSRPADLERVFETMIVPLLSDKPMTGRLAPGIGTAAGAGLVGLVGSQYGQDEISPTQAVAGLLAGAALGSVMGTNFAKQFRTSLTPKQLYRMYFTEAAGMSDSAVGAKYASRVALEGRIREIQDVSNELASFDPATRGLAQAWMAGNANLDTVPVHARTAATRARLIFDELTMDLLKSGLIDDLLLADKLTTNMGTYIPRLMLRYELDNGPREIVESWLRGQGKGWGFISSKNYLKHRADIPEDVLKSLGEITDNPGYLLAKRGTITAADIEQARYHRFIASSAENSIPDSILAAAAKGTQAKDLPEIYTAESGFKAAKWNGQTYWKMPENARYGLLQGKYVEQAVASDIISTHETASGLSKLFEAPLSTFKFFKAVFNPASQFRNMIANTMFADIEAGVAPWRMDKWGRSAIELKRGGKWYREALRDGTFGGEFSVAEITGLLDPSKGSTSMMDHIGDIPMYAGKPAEFFMKWHQTSEAHARLTVYMHAREALGLDGPAAAAFARRTIPDYQDVPRWVKVVRQSPFGAPFISFCLPPDTEILTKDGWKDGLSVGIGDSALSLNIKTGRSEWKRVSDVYRGRYKGDLLHFKDRHLDMLMTPNHRCVVQTRQRIPGQRKTDGVEWSRLQMTQARHLNSRHRIPVSAICSSMPKCETFTDDQVRLVGWFVTEGFWRRYKEENRYASLCQSIPENVEVIRDLLKRLGGHANERRSKARASNATPNHPWLFVWLLRAPLNHFLLSVARDKSLSVEFVTALTSSQLQILVDTMMAGDGHLDKLFTQNPGKTAESFRIACTLAGISNGYSNTGCRTAASVTLRKLNAYTLKRTKPRRVHYDGLVWCPEVADNGTFLARRNGKVFFTGNSYKALPRSLEAAFAFGDPKKMMRFWKYPLAMAALNEYSAQKFGLLGKDEKDKTDIFNTLRRVVVRTLSAGIYTPDSYDTFRKYLPNHVGHMQITVPWRDQYDRPNYLDGTFFLPWGDAGEMGKGDFAKGTGLGWFPRQLEPSNPWFQLGVAAVTGKNSFTGREIIPAGAVGAEAMTSWAKFLVEAWGPAWTPGAGWAAQNLKKSFSGDYASDPNVKSKGTAIASELMGLRTRPVDPESSLRFRAIERDEDIKSMKSELRRVLLDLAGREDLSNEEIEAYLEVHPSAKGSRILSRIKARVDRFNEEYPADEVPQSPQKLLDAIQKQGKK